MIAVFILATAFLGLLAMAVYCTICDLVDVSKRGSRRTVQPA